MEAIILLGAPGSGKGTVAEDLKDSTGYLHLSTGDILRQAVKAGTPTGREAKAFMEKGELVPDDVIARIVREKMESDPPGTKYMLDGFPRTVRQAELLDQMIGDIGGRITYTFLLEVPKELVIQRIGGRRVCRQCGAVYNLRGRMPAKDGVCDACGGEIYQRPDDNEATIINRLDVFAREVEGILKYYEARGLLVRVDARDRLETEKQIVDAINRAAG